MVGKQDFRVKPVPDPVVKVAGKSGGVISKNVLLAQTGVQADMENSEYDLNFKIIEFKVSAMIDKVLSGIAVKGNTFSEEQKNFMKSVPRGDKIYIENIIVSDPDGTIRSLKPISFQIE